ncbi:VPLPA-CTERM sorting domain-containing protein [uncultured Rhodospira sp.]|uniref:VPLPA-CTERM sorting domain-containing protein n=1 Tax=uncultured Rhodospira sp. TaxID=1936189 RepID=UPI00262DDE54|nr:VPLPA-CTERM sorting domain-containing protein [uncultured Rhodospira sp.]
MKRTLLGTVAAGMMVFGATAANAALVEYNEHTTTQGVTLLVGSVGDQDGQLMGANNVDVNGSLYNVLFKEGSCESLFNGCVESAFDFSDWQDAGDAAQALLDQVLVDEGGYLFDSDPTLTWGITGLTQSGLGGVLTPHTLTSNDYGDYVSSSNAMNYSSASGETDAAEAAVTKRNYDLSDYGRYVYADWMPVSEVPLPAAAWFMLTALGGLVGTRWLKGRRSAAA